MSKSNYNREYYQKNKEKLAAYHKKWANNNSEKLAEINRKYTKAMKQSDPCLYYANSTWRTINQKSINGIYSQSPSIQASKQMQAYHRKGIECRITRDELKTFWYNNEQLVKDIITSGGTPSIDRIDDDGHYELCNMQILDRSANIHKSRGHSSNKTYYDKQQIKERNAKAYQKAKREYNLNKRDIQ